MIKVVSNAEMRRLDEYTINEIKIPGLVLMENAGLKSAIYIMNFIQTNNLSGPIHIFCGKGNNGGDGYVIARHFYNDRFNLKVFSIGDPEKLKGDALSNFIGCKNLGINIQTVESIDQLDISENELKELVQQKSKRYNEITKAGVVSGVPELLEILKQRSVFKAIVTSTFLENLLQVMPTEIFQKFDVVITGSDVTNGKPHPEPRTARPPDKSPFPNWSIHRYFPPGRFPRRFQTLSPFGFQYRHPLHWPR